MAYQGSFMKSVRWKTIVTLFVVTVLCSMVIVATAGCWERDPPPGRGYNNTRDVCETPMYDSDLTPGNYCFVATGEKARFLHTDGHAPVSGLIDQRYIDGFTWITVKAGDVLYFNEATIYSESERREKYCFTGVLENGVFLVGTDVAAGTYEVRAAEHLKAGDMPVCEIYADYYGRPDPVRKYDLSAGSAEVTVAEGEFILVDHAVIMADPLSLTSKETNKGEQQETMENNEMNVAEGFVASESPTLFVDILMDSGAHIVLELDADAAPITVANFQKLVGDNFYDGIIFHRIIAGFMIQGGDPDGIGTGGSDEEIKGEFAANGVDNQIAHERGVISMARANDYNSASSQFFICHDDAPHLDGMYAAFGKVISGIEEVDRIASLPTDFHDYPDTPPVMERVFFVERVE